MESVITALVNAGVDRGRLDGKGKGADFPKYPPRSADSYKNRRVEIWLTTHRNYMYGNLTENNYYEA